MKKLLTILFIISTFSVFSQNKDNFSLGLSYSVNSVLSGNIGVISKHPNLYLGAYFGVQLSNDLNGEYYSNINWDEFEEDIVDEGEYFSIYGISVGYKWNVIIFSVTYGLKRQILYQNRYDDFNILGDNGDYYLTKKGDSSSDIGFNMSFLIEKIKIDLGYSKSENVKFGIGLIF